MKKRTLVALTRRDGVDACGLFVRAVARDTTEGGGDPDDGRRRASHRRPPMPGTPEGMFGLPVIDPIDVDASVTLDIAGSSTVFPLSVAVVSLWEDEGGPPYEIASIGSGGGLERFCVEGALRHRQLVPCDRRRGDRCLHRDVAMASRSRFGWAPMPSPW